MNAVRFRSDIDAFKTVRAKYPDAYAGSHTLSIRLGNDVFKGEMDHACGGIPMTFNLSPEVQNAAKWQAQRGYDGSAGTPLPNLMSWKALEEINAKQALFRLCVRLAKTEEGC